MSYKRDIDFLKAEIESRMQVLNMHCEILSSINELIALDKEHILRLEKKVNELIALNKTFRVRDWSGNNVRPNR